MTEIILTQYPGKIIGPIARLIGYIMNSLYMFLNDVFGIQNIAVCIVLFTFIIYFLMMPLTYKQQKFSKLTHEMQPEINAIREKYKNKIRCFRNGKLRTDVNQFSNFHCDVSGYPKCTCIRGQREIGLYRSC